MSGVTDCYQPVERSLKITRSILQVVLEARQSVTIVTKNALVVRDLDILRHLAEQNLAHVTLSLTSLDSDLVRVLEPRTSTPSARLRTIRLLREAGVPVGVLLAPVIPGLNDHEMAGLLQAAAEAGAMCARYVLLRLPMAVSDLFLQWLDTHRPLARSRVEGLIRATRDGALDDARFGCRMRGDAAYADAVAASFRVFSRQYGLDGSMPALDCGLFRPPTSDTGQKHLF
jgi:DNA repair photolyase